MVRSQSTGEWKIRREKGTKRYKGRLRKTSRVKLWNQHWENDAPMLVATRGDKIAQS